MSLWQAVDDRYRELLKLWDDGRVDGIGRDQLSQLVWGRLASGGLGVNVVEATRLSDALAGAAAGPAVFDPAPPSPAPRWRRCARASSASASSSSRSPTWAPQVETLATRVERHRRPRPSRRGRHRRADRLETDAARAERDLVVTTARRRNLARGWSRSPQPGRRPVRAENEVSGALPPRGRRPRPRRADVVRQVPDAPRFAVPDVEALGPVPADRAGLDAFLRRSLGRRSCAADGRGGLRQRSARTRGTDRPVRWLCHPRGADGPDADPEIARVGALARRRSRPCRRGSPTPGCWSAGTSTSSARAVGRLDRSRPTTVPPEWPHDRQTPPASPRARSRARAGLHRRHRGRLLQRLRNPCRAHRSSRPRPTPPTRPRRRPPGRGSPLPTGSPAPRSAPCARAAPAPPARSDVVHPAARRPASARPDDDPRASRRSTRAKPS
jgi:hypothetical protein